MNAIPLQTTPQKCDPQIVKQWAAEHIAIALGLVRECPYHGEPIRACAGAVAPKALVQQALSPLDPAVRAFNGNTREMLAAAENVARTCADSCVFCDAADQEDLD